VCGDVFRVVLAVRVDGEELHALVGISLVQLGQARHEGIVDRTLRPDEDDHDRLAVLQVRQRPDLAGDVLE
jgi:hypothetical protein